MKPKTQIIEAKPSDAKALNAYVEDIFASSDHLITRSAEYHVSTWQRRKWIRRKANNPVEVCLIAVNNGDIVGMLDCWTDNRARVKHSTCFAMSVKRGWRCKGVGTVLLRRFIAWVKENSVLERIELHVHDDNEHAMTLYKSLGFTIEGTRKDTIRYEDGRVVDDHIMALWPK